MSLAQSFAGDPYTRSDIAIIKYRPDPKLLPGLGAGRQLRLPRPTGRVREAQRPVEQRLHGRDQAVPPPPRVPRDDPHDRAGVAEALSRASAGRCARLMGMV